MKDWLFTEDYPWLSSHQGSKRTKTCEQQVVINVIMLNRQAMQQTWRLMPTFTPSNIDDDHIWFKHQRPKV